MQRRRQTTLLQNYSIPSRSPSPPPPPLPPLTISRWSRAEQNSGDSCTYCRGRLASLPTRTTSLSSYSGCRERVTPLTRLLDDEDSCPTLYDRELHSLNIPALRRKDVNTNTFKQHYYPEGGWGWLVCGASFLAHLLTSGLQFAFGLLYLYIMKFLAKKNEETIFYQMATAWMGALCLSVSFFMAPFVVAASRRKSTRLTAVLGGLIFALSCLFASFAMQFHQALLSYGIVLGASAGMVRESSTLVLGHYFKRRREFVEMVAQAGSGIGMALFSVFYKEAVGKLGWRLGMQAVTALLSLTFFLPIVYRSANLYHPQRRAILHLKNQKKKMKEKIANNKIKKTPMFDFSPLKSRCLRVLLIANSASALGIYTPIFYLALQGHAEGLEDSSLVLLQTFMGFSCALGFVGFGIIIIRPNSQCLISRKYLCQASMIGIGISLLALSAIQGYHGYVFFVWLYGICLGGYSYSLKMLTLERIRVRHFTKAWSFVQGAKSIPVLLGVPITGYVNQFYPKAGYYFSFVSTIIGASLMFLVGTKNKYVSTISNYNISDCNTNISECIYNVNNLYCSDLISPNNVYKQDSTHYERIFPTYDQLGRKNLRRQSYKCFRDPASLSKSFSYAANLEYFGEDSLKYISRSTDCGLYKYIYHNNLRPTKSVPEGLACYNGSYKRPNVRNVQVIEQITTSV